MQTSNEHVLEVVSDSICPWCYVGKRRLEGALKLLGSAAPRVEWKPFQLIPGMPVRGMDRREYRSRVWLLGALAATGIAKSMRRARSRHHFAPIRCSAREHPRLAQAHFSLQARWVTLCDPVVEQIFRAYFVEGRDIGDLQVLAEIGAAAGCRRKM